MERILKKYDELDNPVVIPKFVAEYLEFAKDNISLIQVLELASINGGSLTMKKLYDWISANDETFVRAWLDGYEVEEEQKYYVLDSEDIPLIQKTNNHIFKSTTGLNIYEKGRDNTRFEFTEQEIKDYDERYFAFAVPVESKELF